MQLSPPLELYGSRLCQQRRLGHLFFYACFLSRHLVLIIQTDYSKIARHRKKSLRQSLRARRRALTEAEQRLAAQKIFFSLARKAVFAKAKKIAFYIARDGEISTDLLLKFALRNNKACYLPRLEKNSSMSFRRFKGTGRLTPNEFGIPEPSKLSEAIAPWALDLVLMPLVGFDRAGNRLGMGGGFYDRSFAFKRRWPKKGPKLIGLAHDCQRVQALNADSWDIPLNYLISDREALKI